MVWKTIFVILLWNLLGNGYRNSARVVIHHCHAFMMAPHRISQGMSSRRPQMPGRLWPLLQPTTTTTTTATTTTTTTTRNPSRTAKRTTGFELRMSGDGIAMGYQWHEEAFELEVTVTVPRETRAKDIHFKATPNSIELRLKQSGGGGGGVVEEASDDEDDVVLLDPERKLRGRVSMEGTFWVISDPEEADDHRLVTVTIEKQIRTPKDDFDVIDYDWKGVYNQEDDDEVSFRRYDEAEELDVREYAAGLGVDIDNINMSMVDKTMFSSGLNLTQSSLDSLKDSGLMKEVTQQADGSEWTTDKEGDRVPFNSMGGPVSQGQGETIATSSQTSESPAAKIPFLDTDSPWHSSVPVDQRADFVKNVTKASADNVSSSDTQEKVEERKREAQKEELQKQRENQASDPIGTLTVARLKEILKSRGQKVSGNKQELQDRLRGEVNSILAEDDDT